MGDGFAGERGLVEKDLSRGEAHICSNHTAVPCPISLRSGFAISTENGKAANAMTEDEWEGFYNALSKHLRRDYPDLYERRNCPGRC